MYDRRQVARGMKRLMLRLPALRQSLQELAVDNRDVQLLCGAFEDAAAALEDLRKTHSKQQIIQEYEEICADIERDIAQICGQKR